jgi:hypothetical protein
MTDPAFPILFVVSTGRTGTTFLAQFASDQGAQGCHEPGPWWLRHLSNAHASGHADHDRTVRLLRARRAEIGTEAPYLEASCLIYGLVGPLLDAFPTARIVHVVRDPRTYVASGLSWGAYRFGGRQLNVVPYRRLAPPQFRPTRVIERVRWVGQDQFSRLAWAWSAMNRAMRIQGEGHERFRTVRFEDLTGAESGPPLLAELADDLGLGVGPDGGLPPESVVNASGSAGLEAWRSWTPQRRQRLVEFTAVEAEHYGYDIAYS